MNWASPSDSNTGIKSNFTMAQRNAQIEAIDLVANSPAKPVSTEPLPR